MNDPPRTTATAEHDQPGRPQYRRLVRRTDRGMIAGVAAGLSDYFSMDPLVFRIAFVVAILAGGLGLIAYLVMWWLVPPAEPGGTVSHDWLRSSVRGVPTWLGVALLVLGGAVVANGLGIWHPAIFWGLVLIGLGILLFSGVPDAERRRPPRAPRPQPAPQEYIGTAIDQPLPPPGIATVVAPQGIPLRQERERSALGWVTLGVVLLAVGIAALLDSAGAVDMTPVRYPALILAILGIGLAVGARWGRARWLIVPSILLLPVVLAASLIDVPFEGGFGQRYFRPTGSAELASTYRLAGGQLVLDLREVRYGAGSRAVTATVAAGDIEVRVPPNVSLVVDASAGAGVVDLFGRTYEGLRVRVDRTFSPRDSTGQLVLHLHTGLGTVAVYGVAGDDVG